MTRPHEDRQRHTPTDHRPGGPAITLAAPSWWAIAVVNVKSERAPAGVAAYETLVEQARAGATKAHEAAILLSHNQRRVVVLMHVEGHTAFANLAAAWDDHHLFAERRAVAESHTLALYRLVTVAGEIAIDPASHDAYAFAHVPSGTVVEPGFRGSCVFDADDGTGRAIVYRAEQIEQIEAVREAGEAFYPVKAVRTFA
jgi:hypothetical protein